MRPFEYAFPHSEREAVALLADAPQDAVLLAGGTDLMNLMRRDLVAPKRVVDLKRVGSLRGVRPDGDGVLIGALTTLEDLRRSPLLADYASLRDVAEEIRAIQIQQNGTLGGDLCLLPNCWYFRNGYGLLGMKQGKSLVAEGDNRYHAILGNQGAAKFVSASRLAPALIAWGAKVRIVGPAPDEENLLPLEYLYVTPKTHTQGVTSLKPGQFVSHVWLPSSLEHRSASYEVLETNGLDWPTVAASACLLLQGSLVREANIVLGHVAPIPWQATAAAMSLIGQPITETTASNAAEIALADATPLSGNGYKVQQARAAVKRALLKSVGLWEGGL